GPTRTDVKPPRAAAMPRETTLSCSPPTVPPPKEAFRSMSPGTTILPAASTTSASGADRSGPTWAIASPSTRILVTASTPVPSMTRPPLIKVRGIPFTSRRMGQHRHTHRHARANLIRNGDPGVVQHVVVDFHPDVGGARVHNEGILLEPRRAGFRQTEQTAVFPHRRNAAGPLTFMLDAQH